jgi:regulatory protein
MIGSHRHTGAAVEITAIEPQKHHLERVNVYVDGEFRLALAQELVYRHALGRGDEVTEAKLEALAAEDQLWKARDSALNLLSYRARTATELQRRLREKAFPEEVVEQCVADLVERGLVDDSAFAETFVRDRVRFKPRGSRRLVQELRAKGVDADTATEAIAEVLRSEEVSELELAREVVAKWARRSGEEPERARRRLYGHLARRGFGGDTVRQIMDEVEL